MLFGYEIPTQLMIILYGTLLMNQDLVIIAYICLGYHALVVK